MYKGTGEGFRLLAFAQLLVKREQGSAVLPDHLEPLDDLGGRLFLLDLLLDEPVEQYLQKRWSDPMQTKTRACARGGRRN